MIKWLQGLKRRKGFTLVELIIVIAIIGVLAAVLIPLMVNYMTSAQVMSANSTAASLKKAVDAFLTTADSEGYGMLKSQTNNATFVITIVQSNWTITRTGGTFAEGGVLDWAANGVGTGTIGQAKTAATNCESLLAITLTDLFPEVVDGTFTCSLHAGKCVAVAFCRNRTADLVEGSDYPTLNADGSFPYSYSWNGYNAGISPSGEIIGTAPIVDLG